MDTQLIRSVFGSDVSPLGSFINKVIFNGLGEDIQPDPKVQDLCYNLEFTVK